MIAPLLTLPANYELILTVLLYDFFSEKIHVNGCMDVIRSVLFKHVMPILMICALTALVVALIELLLLFCAGELLQNSFLSTV